MYLENNDYCNICEHYNGFELKNVADWEDENEYF